MSDPSSEKTERSLLTLPNVFTGMAGLTGSLAVLLMVVPESAGLLGMTVSPATSVVSRRTAILYAAWSVVAWSARNAAPSPLRLAVGRAMAGMWLALALYGTVSFFQGVVGPGIFFAVAGELLFAMAYVVAEQRSP